MYSGKEMSPLGLGCSARSGMVGAEMVGRDGTMWVIAVKNGDKNWVRSPEKLVLEKDVPLGDIINVDFDSKYKVTLGEKRPLCFSPKPPKAKAAEFDTGHQQMNDSGYSYVVTSDKNGKKKWLRLANKDSSPLASPPTSPPLSPTDTESVIHSPVAKKERKKRGPTAYNLFIGAKLRELRETEPNLPTTEYMCRALLSWKAATETM
jgi:hypothetical protein